MDLDELYQEIILDHFKNPARRAPIGEGEALADEENPNCGDHVRLALQLEDGRIRDLHFDGDGCAISMASASILCDFAEGRTAGEAREVIETFVAMMRGERPFEAGELDDLNALAGVRRYPMRVKCATMSWHALEKALDRLEGKA